MKFLWLLWLALAPAMSTAWADEEGEDEALSVAHRYGTEHLDRLEALKFSCAVRTGTVTVNRSWTWDAASGEVTLETPEGHKKKKHTFALGNPAPDQTAFKDLFLHDRAWLLFPSNLIVERGLEAMFDENEKLPIPPGRSDRLVVDFVEGPHPAGGRVFELFIDDDRIVRQWTLRSAWSKKPSLATTWEDYARMGPVLVSLRRRSGDGAFELVFSDVEARWKGHGWEKAEPSEPRRP